MTIVITQKRLDNDIPCVLNSPTNILGTLLTFGDRFSFSIAMHGVNPWRTPLFVRKHLIS